MKRKIGVALGIFLLLFSGSWFLDQKQTKLENEVRINEPEQGRMNISNIKTDENQILKTNSTKFMPREYIRIQKK